MPHPQNSARGLHAKWRYETPAGYGLQFDDYSTTNNLVTANSTGLRVTGRVRVNDARYIGANSTAFLFTAQAAKPATRTAGFNWTFITNGTGQSALALRSTGTTWKYCSLTSVLPT